MPFKSKAQQRMMFHLQSAGKLKPGTAEEWAHATKNVKKLPEHVHERARAKKMACGGMAYRSMK